MVSRSQRVCRLCEFPAADGGVPLDALDADKWAEWCRRELGLGTIGGIEEAQHTLICQYCIWEASIAHESSLDNWSENEKGCDWWTGHDDDHFFQEYFYKKPVIQPCKVVLEKISSDFEHLLLEDIDCSRSNAHLEANNPAYQTSKQVEKESDIQAADSKSTKIYQCAICQIICHNYYYLRSHIKSIHKNVVKCKSCHCRKYFLTEDERREHEQNFHLTGEGIKMVKCFYCGALLTRKKLCKHIKKQHKEAIKCDYKKACPNYFHTESEKNEHIFNEHTGGLEHKSTPVKCIYCDKIFKNKYEFRLHVYKIHRDVRIKCRVQGCAVYFLSKKESEQHFLQVHQHAESLKKWQCPKCSYVASFKKTLKNHLERIHVNKDYSTRLKCPQCPKYFPARLNLKDHIQNIHAGRCTCQYCGKTMLKMSLSRHLLYATCKPIPI